MKQKLTRLVIDKGRVMGINSTKKTVFLALLVAIGLALSIVESFIPLPFIAPGAKLGLANIVSITALIVFGLKEALIVALLRSFTFALATGSFSNIMYSLPSAVFSIIVMFMVFRFFSGYFSLIGISIFGAIFHNITQIGVASLMMENIKIFSYLPVMTLVSLFTGYFVGLTSIFITKNLRTNFKKISN